MQSYTKLSSAVIHSSVWGYNSDTKVVWITLLAMADQNGEVHANITGLARAAGVPLDVCRTAVSIFMAPDPDSTTPDEDGRRLMPIEGGWVLINHGKYRKLASREERRAEAAERAKRLRAHACATVRNRAQPCAGVRNGAQMTVQAEAEAEADTKTTEGGKPPDVRSSIWGPGNAILDTVGLSVFARNDDREHATRLVAEHGASATLAAVREAMVKVKASSPKRLLPYAERILLGKPVEPKPFTGRAFKDS
jgi:hypothetical protein